MGSSFSLLSSLSLAHVLVLGMNALGSSLEATLEHVGSNLERSSSGTIACRKKVKGGRKEEEEEV